MKVAELIELLKSMPQDATVVGRGYESGYDEIDYVKSKLLIQVPNAARWEGAYERDDSSGIEIVTLTSKRSNI